MLCLYRGRLIRVMCFHVFVQRWSSRKNVSGSKRYAASTYRILNRFIRNRPSW